MKGGRLLSGLVAVLTLALPSASLLAEECSQPGQFYEASGYTVTKVSLESPLDVAHLLQRYAGGQGLLLHVRDVSPGSGQFRYTEFLASASQLATMLDSKESIGLSVVVPVTKNCNRAEKTMEVVYRVYHLGIPMQPPGGSQTLPAPPIRIASNDLSRTLSIQPSAGYDAARHFFGGGAMELYTSKGVPINDLYVSGYGSSSSMQLQAHLSGGKSWLRSPIRQLQWGVAYADVDLPSGVYSISEKHLSARVAAVSQRNSNPDLILHFGAAVEGGNQHASGPAVPSSAGVLSSPVGAVKMYLGASFVHHATSLTGSYGLQLGSARSAAELDFTKHIVNGSFSTSFVPVAHHPLGVDVNLGAGWLVSHGTIPLAERFFGGNVSRPFLAGDAWVMQSNPILRSFPGRTFAASNGPYGGTSFFSLSTNVAYPVWVKPLVPKQIEAEIGPMLTGQLGSGEAVLADSYVADGAAYKAVEAVLSAHAPAMQELRTRLTALRATPGATTNLRDAIDDALSDLDFVDQYMGKLNKRDAAADALEPVLDLVAGEGPFHGYLSDLADDLDAVGDAFDDALKDAVAAPAQQPDRSYFTDIAKGLRSLRESSLAQYKAIDRKAEDAKAKASLAYLRYILSELLNTINLSSISPTLLFDAAWLGPRPANGGAGMRYGIGPAVRLGLINLELTAGYSVNIQRRPGEPRGAAVVGLTFRNLF